MKEYFEKNVNGYSYKLNYKNVYTMWLRNSLGECCWKQRKANLNILIDKGVELFYAEKYGNVIMVIYVPAAKRE